MAPILPVPDSTGNIECHNSVCVEPGGIATNPVVNNTTVSGGTPVREIGNVGSQRIKEGLSETPLKVYNLAASQTEETERLAHEFYKVLTAAHWPFFEGDVVNTDMSPRPGVWIWFSTRGAERDMPTILKLQNLLAGKMAVYTKAYDALPPGGIWIVIGPQPIAP